MLLNSPIEAGTGVCPKLPIYSFIDQQNDANPSPFLLAATTTDFMSVC